MTWVHAPSVGEAETAGCWDVESETAVVIVCWTNIETVCFMGSPGSTSGRVIVNQCFCAEQCERRFVEAKWAVEFVVGRDVGIASGES